MPYQVGQLIEGQGPLVCVSREDSIAYALSLMIEHDFSQLPVINHHDDLDDPEGMVTYEGILRGIRNFDLKIDELKVRDVMVDASIYYSDDDLFDILDKLKETNAVLVLNRDFPEIEGIVTSYDATEYFRNRTEDLMRVEDIEVIIKDLIKEGYTSWNYKLDDELDEAKLDQAVKLVSNRGQNAKPKTFDQLTMAEYINLLTLPDTWEFFHTVFNLPIESVKSLLNNMREIRNLLAHFRGDLTAEQRDSLKFTAEWLARCQLEYQGKKELEKHKKFKKMLDNKEIELVPIPTAESLENANSPLITEQPSEFSVLDSASGGGRYAALADRLQSQPGRVDQVQLTFKQVEEIIGANLPDSARSFRAWWANDSVGHIHSQLWLDAGWRTTYVNLTDGRVTFSRIREREKLYINFFSKLLEELRKKATFDIKNMSPDGASWIVIQKVPRSGKTCGSFTYSFSRDKRLRVELYLDLQNQEQTKAVYDRLYAQKEIFESRVGKIEWERLNNRRASRLAVYKDGQIMDNEKYPELIKWAVETMIKFYDALLMPTEKAIEEVKTA